MTCSECKRLRIDVERYKASAGMWRHKCYELGGTPLPWEPEELIQRAVQTEREACAKVCEEVYNAPSPYCGCEMPIVCADAIRDRGNNDS